MERVDTLSYNLPLILDIYRSSQFLKKKFAHLIVECVKVVYLIYQLTTKQNTMKKETAQLLAVFLVACYLIGQLQDIYSR